MDELVIKEFPPTPGAGRIIVSGATVHGQNTSFIADVVGGDILIIRHPETLAMESQVVSVVLSNRSLAVKEPWSSSFTTFVQYEIKKQSVEEAPKPTLKQEFGTKLNKLSKKIKKESTLTYREKTGMWGYKYIK